MGAFADKGATLEVSSTLRMESVPILTMLREVVARPFSAGGFIAAVACALPMLLELSDLDLRGPTTVLSAIAVAFVYVLVVAHAGRGQHGFPIPNVLSKADRAELGRSLGAGICLLLLGVLPTVVWRSIVGGDGALDDVELLLAFVVPSAFLPAAIVAVAVEGSAAAAFWPFGWARVARASPLEYAKLIVGFTATMVIVGFVQATLEPVARHSVLLAFSVSAIGNLVWIAQAAYVGTFVRRYVEDVPVMSARKPVLIVAGE